jgi:hypothetical protein
MRYFLPGLVALLIPLSSGAATDDAIEKATNPLHLSTSVALQDYYTPELYGSDHHTNDTLFRMTTPFAANELVPVPQILRMTVPLATRPQPGGGYATGLGDINLFDIFLLKQDGIAGYRPPVNRQLRRTTKPAPASGRRAFRPLPSNQRPAGWRARLSSGKRAWRATRIAIYVQTGTFVPMHGPQKPC